MSEKDTGGPAFPLHFEIRPKLDTEWCGMTLRDYFAAKAMQAWISRGDDAADGGIATLAYRMAELMLEARK